MDRNMYDVIHVFRQIGGDDIVAPVVGTLHRMKNSQIAVFRRLQILTEIKTNARTGALVTMDVHGVSGCESSLRRFRY